MNNQEFAIESFISFCDDMVIAEEGFKDGIKNIGKNILKGIQFIWGKFLELCRRVKTAAKTFFFKNKKSKSELIKEKDAEIAKLKAQLKASNVAISKAADTVDSSIAVIKNAEEKNKQLRKHNEDLETKIKKLEEEKEKLKNSESSDDVMNEQLRRLDATFGSIISEIRADWFFEDVRDLNEELTRVLNGESVRVSEYHPHKKEYSKYHDKYSEYFEQFKNGLRTAYTSPSGRIQEAFILTKLKIIDNTAADFDKIRKELEGLINKADGIKDDTNKKVFLTHVNDNYILWGNYVKKLTALQSVFYDLLAETNWTERTPRSQGLNEEDEFTKSKFNRFTPMDKSEVDKLKK